MNHCQLNTFFLTLLAGLLFQNLYFSGYSCQFLTHGVFHIRGVKTKKPRQIPIKNPVQELARENISGFLKNLLWVKIVPVKSAGAKDQAYDFL